MFPTPFRALVLGAHGAIGQAFVDVLHKDTRCAHVEQVSRSQGRGFDLLEPDGLAAQAQWCAARGPYHLILDATGALTIDGVGPEKSLAALRAQGLATAFAINAIGPLMALRHFSPLLAPGPSVYAKLSARVGSIGDNRKGGWYGYRASKAALNMFLQTAAIELQRKQPELRVVALQPGTVRSALSHPFSAGLAQVLEPHDAAARLMAVLQGLSPKAGAHFVDHAGQNIPW
ncbi:MAG: SDR family NAD(P)-dependent oxidoreductase [Rhodoferax sp.]|nr:SDR family NAD(P)-dependent oxidoreductase [Rhodoferax sp.]